MRILWLVLLVVFLVAEGATSFLVSIWFAAGALVSLIISLFIPDFVVVQLIAFVLVSGLCLFAFRPLVQKLIGNKRTPTNADANIGKLCQVVQEIQPGRTGRVKLEGLEWAAVCDYVLPVGAWGKVIAIEGVKLVLVPAEYGTQNEQPQNESAESVE